MGMEIETDCLSLISKKQFSKLPHARFSQSSIIWKLRTYSGEIIASRKVTNKNKVPEEIYNIQFEKY